MPKVSVVMPAYNAEKYIGESIKSILNQTFIDFEFIIINDGSRDRTKEIILSYSDDRIVYLENEINSGIVVTLNKGLEYATGEYIARMDADDIAVAERLEKQIEFMEENKDVGVLGTGICIFGEDVQEQARVFTTNPEQLKAELIFNSCIAHPTVMMRSNILKNNGLSYDLEYAGAEDYNLWWKIAKVSRIATIPDLLVKYRIHSSQITKKKDEKYYKMMEKLMEERFSDIGFKSSDIEKKVFMKYCLGEYETFSQKEVEELVDCLVHLLRCNKSNKYFSQKKLIKIFELAIIYTLNNSRLSDVEKKQSYKYAVKAGAFTLVTRLKVLYHRMYR